MAGYIGNVQPAVLIDSNSVKNAVENASDSNVFSDADHTKLDGIAAGATVASQPTITVTVAGGKFVIDGTSQQTITMSASGVYKFDVSDSSNSSHPFRISTTVDGTHGGGSAIGSPDFISSGTAGQAGAYVTFTIQQGGAETYYFYCANHSGMGGEIKKLIVPSGAFAASTVTVSDHTTLTAAQNGYLVNVTATAEKIISLPAAAAGAFYVFNNDTSNIIYIKPNGTNTINGVGVSLSLAPAASGIMACGGSSTNWSSVGITRTMIVAKTTTFYNNNSDDGTTNQITGTYTPQLGTSMLICVGSCTAGAQHSGAGGSYYYRSGGSGGSSYAEKFIASPAASYAYTISGKGNTSYNDNTSATKTTTVAGMTCTRGAGPPVQSTGSAHLSGRTGGTATGGTVNFTGGTGATPSATGNVGRNAGGGGAATRAGNGGNGASNAGGGTGGNNASQDTAGAAATAKDSNSYAVPNSTAETYQAGVAFTGTGEVDSRNPTGASPKTLVNIGSVSFAIADHENLTTGASGGAGGAGYSRSATQGGYITFVEFI